MAHHYYCRGVEQLVARRAHNPEVIGSNPIPATRCGEIAQAVEQKIENLRVPGSNPGLATIFIVRRWWNWQTR